MRKTFVIFIVSMLLILVPCFQALGADITSDNTGCIPYTDEQMKATQEKIDKLEQDAAMYDTLQTEDLTRATSVTLGDDITIYGATNGAIYTSHSYPRTYGSYGTNSYGWVDCRSEFQYPGGEGDGYCWGWIGKYISVSGSGSEDCTITFSGDYDGTLQAYCTLASNSCGVQVKVQVYDVTGGGFSLVDEETVASRFFALLMLPNDIRGDIDGSDSIDCTLQGGHNYLLRIKLYTEASTEDFSGKAASYENQENDRDLVDWSLSDFHNNGADGQGVDYDYVNINWD